MIETTAPMNLSREERRMVLHWRKARKFATKTAHERWPRAIKRLEQRDADPERKAQIQAIAEEPAFETEWDSQDFCFGPSPEYCAWRLRLDRVLRDRQKAQGTSL